MADHTIKQHDTGGQIAATLTDGAGGLVNLLGATVRFCLRRVGASSATVAAAAVVQDTAGGQVAYTWQAGDTDAPGSYHGEFEVTFADQSIQTFPSDGYLTVEILPDLG